MAKKSRIDIDTLRQLIHLNEATGELIWKTRPRSMFKTEGFFTDWNNRKAGTIAFTSTHHNGYKQGLIFKDHYYAHSIIWALLHGKWPDQIDHIDGDRANNLPSNLREAPQSENMKNKKIYKNNTTGACGVRKTRSGRFYAQAQTGGVVHRTGTFDDFDDAVKARQALQTQLNFHENHGQERVCYE